MSDQAQWGTLTIKVPDFLETAREAVNSVAEFLITILDIVLAALALVKAFLSNFLDPILALIQKIIDEINALIQDIRQMGIYVTGDWKLFKYPFDDLRGGYSAFERRMLVRMTDTTDPTRPNVSGRMKVFGAFFYLSVDISEIQRLIAFIMRLIAFFKQNWSNSSLPTCSITEVRYGMGAVDIMHPMSLGDAFLRWDAQPPNLAEVRWKIRTDVGQQNPFNPFPPNLFGPDGFIVTVSTYPDGIKVCYDKPQNDADMKSSNASSMTKIQPRAYGLVRKQDGRPLVLHGGTQMLKVPASMGWNGGTSAVGAVPGKIRVYGQGSAADNFPIPFEAMDGYFQKTFWVDTTATVFQSFTGEYSIVLRLDDMPLEGTFALSGGQVTINSVDADDGTGGKRKAATVHVRVAACNKAAIEKQLWDLSNPLAAKLGPLPGVIVAPTAGEVNITDIGEFSRPTRVTFPNAYTAAYLASVKTACVVLFLTRPDLVPFDQFKMLLSADQLAQISASKLLVSGTVATPCGLESLKHLLRVMFDGARGPQWWCRQRGEDPTSFRLALWRRANKFASDLYAKSGPQPEIEKFVATNTAYLRSVTWGQIISASGYSTMLTDFPTEFREAKLLDSLDADGEAGTGGKPVGNDIWNGVAANPWCIGEPWEVVDNLFYVRGAIQGRRGAGMYEMSTVDGKINLVTEMRGKEQVAKYLADLPSGLRERYKRYITKEGNIKVPSSEFDVLNKIVTTGKLEGSGDESPIIFHATGQPAATKMIFCRDLLMNHQGPDMARQLMTETQIALSLAGNLWKRNDDGAWIAIRFFDVFPGIDDFLQALRNWIEALKNLIQSIIDTILKYIAWLEARIMDIQQLIRRINALIQSLLGFLFQVPACSYMACLSDGTGGLLGDFMGARDKPNDSPLAYGAGVALVIPFCPGFLYDLIMMLLVPKHGHPSGSLAGAAPLDMIPLEGLPEPPPDGDDVPPDVL